MSETYSQRAFAVPPDATDLIVIRHGASAALEPGETFELVEGHGDPPLAPEGREQARRVAERLHGEPLRALFVTPLQRTHQTAEPLVAATGLEPQVIDDLREVHLGEWEGGLFRLKVADGDPLALRMFEEQSWSVIPGAESDEAISTRVRAAIERIAAAHPDQRVAAFAHGGTIGNVLHQATGSQRWAFVGADNASISHIVVTADRWIVRRFNDTSHLEDTLTAAPEPPT